MEKEEMERHGQREWQDKYTGQIGTEEVQRALHPEVGTEVKAVLPRLGRDPRS